MDVHVTDDQIGRYFRRIQLGLRLLSHGARAQTTCEWSGLTPDQLITLRRRWMFNADERLRGPSPTSFQIFFRSSRMSNEAALFIGICQVVGVRLPASLENGERLCEAFEAYREWEPEAEFEFEQAVLLLTGAAQAEKIELTRCSECLAALLVDKFGASRRHCRRCKRERGSRRKATGGVHARSTSVETSSEPALLKAALAPQASPDQSGESALLMREEGQQSIVQKEDDAAGD